MSRTVYQIENANFSNVAHFAARQLLYPLIFGENLPLTFEDTDDKKTERHNILDGEMGVDKIIKVTLNGYSAPLSFSIQERFRRRYGKRKDGSTIDYTTFNDITITEWNKASGLPSEFYKINAGYFLYAYYDETNGSFVKPIMFNVSDLLLALCHNSLLIGRGENKKQQTFLTIRYPALKDAGVVKFYREVVKNVQLT